MKWKTALKTYRATECCMTLPQLLYYLQIFIDYIEVNLCYNHGWSVSLGTFVSFIYFEIYMFCASIVVCVEL